MGTFAGFPFLLPFFVFVLYGTTLFSSSGAADTVDGTTSLRDGETLVSPGGSFELGFVSLGASPKRRYLCIRFTKGQEMPVVWVANREHPLNDSTGGVLKFEGDGNLAVLDGVGNVLWSTGLASNASGRRAAQLLDTGNLVVKEAGDGLPGSFLWQSFHEPGDTLLPGMKLQVSTKISASRHLTSWKSADDPSPGNYSFRMEINILPRLVLREGSSTIKFTTGFWNGIRFTGHQPMNANDFFNSSVVFSGDEAYYTDRLVENSNLLRVWLDSSGEIHRFVWREKTKTWFTLWTAPNYCEQYARCGPYGTCAEDGFPSCNCLRGFRPKSPQEWSFGRGTDGCVRSTNLSCSGGDAFLPVTRVKLPELNINATVDMEMNLEECRERCARDCSCTAYASADVKEGRSGCIIWSGDLVDMRNNSNNVQEFYLRVAASDADSISKDVEKRRGKQLAIITSISIILGMFLLVLCGFWMRKLMKKKGTDRRENDDSKMVDGKDVELPLFDIETITFATDNFSIANKIGEGGFGIVYKGALESGREIAIKRLSCPSIQGAHEFMNEARLIAKLQHKNLVRLLGCCIQRDERMLIFEYMENTSLDSFIFDESKRTLLNWSMRFDIILGIVRGLLYLHHDSRLKIIHRDLKAGNILLDGALNPKISDFGTARIFEANQHTERTKRVIGTYGYMSPEYAINGIISTKSDVFSFGVIVLEVLSGIRSRGIYEPEHHLNLLSLAWKLWREGNCLELLDPMVASSYDEIQLSRCLQVGLLCVQQHASDRPTMCEVLTMLSSEKFSLPNPKEPGFLVFESPFSLEISPSSKKECLATNGLTNTSTLEGR